MKKYNMIFIFISYWKRFPKVLKHGPNLTRKLILFISDYQEQETHTHTIPS